MYKTLITPKQMLDLMKEFSKVAGYRINTHKYLVFLYTNNKLHRQKLIIPFIISSKIIKYLGIKLTKELKDLYTEYHDTFMKETVRTHK